jgi:hypothetical protein
MTFPRIVLLAIALLAGAVLPSQARLMAVLSYQELLDRSDLVVIARPRAITADTTERAFLLDIFRQDKDGKQSEIAAIGVETAFKIDAVLKGDKSVEQFVLHHYREANSPGVQVNGPFLVSFDPANPSSYLLFLVRETDGRFAAAGGQTDPGFRAIGALPT